MSEREGKDGAYDVPHEYANLDEIADPEPIENPESSTKIRHHGDLESNRDEEKIPSAGRKSQGVDEEEGLEEVPDEYRGLDELVGPSPVENPEEHQFYRHHDLEEVRTHEQTSNHDAASRERSNKEKSTPKARRQRVLIHLYVTSYLILFAILGTLARLGITALTTYPGTPIIITEIWANVAGSFVLGWLTEDRFLLRKEWGILLEKAMEREKSQNSSSGSDNGDFNKDAVIAATKEEHSAAKKTSPLYIGLAVGFCGSLTSFSSFMRDTFLSLDNGLRTLTYTSSGAEIGQIYARNAGYSVMAVLGVVILEVSLSMSALHFGADFAIAIEPKINSLPRTNLRRFLDPAIMPVALGAWIGSVIMSIWPPDRPGGPAANGRTTWAEETWRGQVLFAMVFAPVGCLLRFHLSLLLNGKLSSFPLGTFMVNILGTMVIGMSWDLQHANLGSGLIGGGRVGCQVLQGIEDGFCGCLTTVSTWVLELKGLQRKHAYIYGGASVVLGIASLVVIMGSLNWTVGFASPVCMT